MNKEDYIIVRFLPNQCFCFSTKARVPTKISVECIKIKDTEKWDENYVEVKEENNEIFSLVLN